MPAVRPAARPAAAIRGAAAAARPAAATAETAVAARPAAARTVSPRPRLHSRITVPAAAVRPAVRVSAAAAACVQTGNIMPASTRSATAAIAAIAAIAENCITGEGPPVAAPLLCSRQKCAPKLANHGGGSFLFSETLNRVLSRPTPAACGCAAVSPLSKGQHLPRGIKAAQNFDKSFPLAYNRGEKRRHSHENSGNV